MKIVKIIAFALACMQFSAGADSSANDDTLITLSGAVAYVADSSITMRYANNSKNKAYVNLVKARNMLYPSVQSGLSAERQIDPSRPVSANGSINVKYTMSPSLYADKEQSLNRSSASEFSCRQTRNDQVIDLIIQYIKLVCAAELIDVEETNVAYQEHKYAEINAFFKQGAKSRADVLQQKAAVAEARIKLLQTVQEHERINLSLLDKLDLPLSRRYSVDTVEVARIKNMVAGDTAENRFIDSTEKDEITAQRYNIAAEAARLRSQRLAYIPSAAVSAGWNAAKIRESVSGSSNSFSTSLSVGASVSVPLFDNRSRWQNIRQAELDLEDSRIKLEELQKSADLAIAQAALEDAMAKDRISSSRIQVEAAQEALLAMEERYRAGSSTLSDLNSVQSKFIEARSALVLATFDRTVSRITLLHETGQTEQVYGLLNIGSLEKRQ